MPSIHPQMLRLSLVDIFSTGFAAFLWLIAAVITHACTPLVALMFISPVIACGAEHIAEFTPADAKALDWRVVDDGVMGGVSQGNFTISDDGILRFFGTLSLENNGGFSSLRSADVALDLSQAQGVTLRVKGDGRSYQLRFSTDATYRGSEMSFQATFATVKGRWIEVPLPISQFKGTWRGVDLSDRPFDPSKIRRIGLLLADKQAGPFELQVDWIRPDLRSNIPATNAP